MIRTKKNGNNNSTKNNRFLDDEVVTRNLITILNTSLYHYLKKNANRSKNGPYVFQMAFEWKPRLGLPLVYHIHGFKKKFILYFLKVLARA